MSDHQKYYEALEKSLNDSLKKSRAVVKNFPIDENRKVRDKLKEALYWLKVKREI